ncbi:MAG: sugar ABC transporter permease [Spirochaetales bacterium]|nr:sugar ABC transporter permease [Spirochaetales bacterium]
MNTSGFMAAAVNPGRRFSRRRTAGQTLSGLAFIGPNFILMIVFWLFPVVFAFVLSFTNWDLLSGLGGIEFIGFDNYRSLPGDDKFLRSLLNNLYFTAAVVPLTVILGLAAAVIIHEHVWGKKVFRLVFFLPYISNIVAVSIVWSLLYRHYGPIANFLRVIGIEHPPSFLADMKWALPAIIAMSVWMQIGYACLIYSAGLQGISKDLYEAAEIDGINRWKRLTLITIPLLRPTTFFIVITSLITSFQVFAQVQVMTDGGPAGSTSVLVFYIYQNAFRFYRFGYASAIAVVLFVIIFLITLIQWIYQKRLASDY